MRNNDLMEIDEPVPARHTKKKASTSFLGKLWANIIFRNVVYAVGGFLVLIFVINFVLLIGTNHGKSFPVPDFAGMTMEEAEATATQHNLRLEVSDSVYMPQLKRGAIFRQSPEANAQVKKNRRIFLTVNSLSPRKVLVPDVVGFSLRQAKAVLLSQGLTVGKLRYTSDIATNNVLNQSFRGQAIDGNLKVNMGSTIDLELGLSGDGTRTVIPSAIGLSAEAARDVLVDNSLNISLNYDKSIATYADSLAARVYRQLPSPSQSSIWPLGTRVEVYLRLNENTAGKN